MTDNDSDKKRQPGRLHQFNDFAPGQNSEELNPRLNSGEEEEEDKSEQNKEEPGSGTKSLADELAIEDLSRCIYFKDSKIFAAAGPGIPLLQVNTDGTFVSLDPEKPYRPDVDEDVVPEHADEHGRLIDVLGQVRKLTGMKYKGQQLFFVNKKHPDNGKPLAAWFDDDWKPHYLYLGGTILSAQMVLKIRERMIDGELSAFQELTTD